MSDRHFPTYAIPLPDVSPGNHDLPKSAHRHDISRSRPAPAQAPHTLNPYQTATMPHHHNVSLTYPFRTRAHSDPTPITPRSFTVDRTSTRHTVYTMMQLDGASESKLTSPPSRTSTAKKRCSNVFRSRSKKRANSSLDVIDARDDNDNDDNDAPMRVVSPRATEIEPVHSAARKRTFSFKKRLSNNDKKAPPTSPARHHHAAVEAPTTAGHVPVTDMPYRSPARRQSVLDVGTMGSPTREMALSSHPVGKADNGRRESGDDKFESPLSMLDGVSAKVYMP